VNLRLLQGVFSGLIADIAGYIRGSIFRGGAADWEVYDAKTSGYILVGDGTDINSVVVGGEVTLAADGTTIVDNILRVQVFS
jgi:hypothetical protein